MFGQFDNNTPKGYGMNGGFSYRRKSGIMHLLTQISDKRINDFRISQGFYPYGEVSEDSFYYHAVEILGKKKASDAIANQWFMQDRLINDYNPFSFHGITYGYLNLEEFYNRYCK